VTGGGTSILCGVDGSPDADAAVTVAARMAATLGARLVLVHVAEPVVVPYSHAAPFGGLSAAGPWAAEEQRVAQKEDGFRLLEQVADSAGLRDVDLRVELGMPAERLAELADDENAELIVVGSRGRGAFRAAFPGSVSTSVLGLATCPVLVVPPGAGGA
jgi:nucleotide-binding universal stress UspA family protein